MNEGKKKEKKERKKEHWLQPCMMYSKTPYKNYTGTHGGPALMLVHPRLPAPHLYLG